MAKYTKLTGIYMSPEMHHNLRIIAAQNNLTVSQYVRRLINQDKTYQKQNEKECK